MNTSYIDVLNVFHSLLKSKFEIDEDLEYQWFLNALADYELEIGFLEFSEESRNLKVGEVEIKIIHTKGHSKGGVSYLIGDMLCLKTLLDL